MTLNTNVITIKSGQQNKKSIYSPIGNFADLFNDKLNNEFVKKYEVIEVTEDLLTLSCVWFRLRTTNDIKRHSITSLLNENLFLNICDEDRQLSSAIRDYYSKKLMVLTLKEHKLTKFRQDLSDFVNGDSMKFTENVLGLAFRLPEFYKYDIKFDEIKHQFKHTLPIHTPHAGKHFSEHSKVDLIPMHKFTRCLQKSKFNEYWLRDNDSYAYRFTCKPTNPLVKLWEREFSRDRISGYFFVSKKVWDDVEFYEIEAITEI